MFLKKSGKFLGAALGFASGVVGGGLKAAATLIDGGDLKDAEKEFDQTLNNFVDKGQELGEEHFPAVAKEVGKVVAVVVTVAAVAKAADTIAEKSKNKSHKKKKKENKLNSGWAAAAGTTALLGSSMIGKNQNVSKIRFVKSVVNLKA